MEGERKREVVDKGKQEREEVVGKRWRMWLVKKKKGERYME